jgi:glucokinase
MDTRHPLAGDGHVAAVDLGGTKILAAIVAPSGEIVSRTKKATGKDRRPGPVLDRVAECVRRAAQDAGVELARLGAVGVGAPGPVDADRGALRTAPNLEGWQDVPVEAELGRRLGVPVALDNDVRVAVIAEGAAGAGRGHRNWIALWPGTGIGGAIVLDGEVVTGVNNSAGELGHITVKAGGPKCGCGGRGHLEALASRTAIVRWIEKKVDKGAKTSLTKKGGRGVGEVRSDDLRAAFDAGDKLVTRAIERGASYLAIGIASVANAVNPELVVLGGGLIEAMGEPFVRLVEKQVRKHPLRAATANLRVVASQLGDDAGITGAALVARRRAARPAAVAETEAATQPLAAGTRARAEAGKALSASDDGKGGGGD